MNKKIFHILVVDDDDRIRELVKQYLEENNFLITTAKDVLDAKKKLEIIRFDIIILDIMMPGESGLSLTKELRKNDSTPIILLTAKGETKDRIGGLELGADDYLGKPFEPKELLLRINNILNKIKKTALPEEIYIGNALVNLKKLEIIRFDIIILDIMMPGESGLSLTKELRKNDSTPIILLTAKGETKDRIGGLELGADDYLGKPFEPKELLLRINNILNKIKKSPLLEEIYIGNALVNLKKLDIKINNKIKKINPQEKKVLEKMLELPGKIFSRDDIGKIINISKERTIDVMITRLRKKIEFNPKNPKYLQTIRGSGYVLWIE